MRSNYERYGSLLIIDAMKAELNTWLWPYIAVCSGNENNTTVVCCESLMAGERKEAYVGILKMMV